MVGITAMTLTLLDVIKTVGVVKRVDRGIEVVLGGPHVHLYPEETINMPGVDYLVLGEGEITFAQLLEQMDDPQKLEEIQGLVFRVDGRVVNTGLAPFIEDLDSLPFPARHLTPYWKYRSLRSF